jgi:hypothetical protein
MIDTSTAGGRHFRRIYVTWAPIQAAFSDNNGQHWTGPITVSDKSHQFDQDARINIGPMISVPSGSRRAEYPDLDGLCLDRHRADVRA